MNKQVSARADVKLVLTDLIARYQELCKDFDTIQTLFGVDSQVSTFSNNVWVIFENYVDLIDASVLGGNDHLSWFIYDNDCGEGGKIASVDGFEIKVTDLDSLLDCCGVI